MTLKETQTKTPAAPMHPARLRRKTLMSGMTMPLDQIVRAYLDDLLVRNYTPKTINGYGKNLRTFVAWTEGRGARSLAQFDAELVKEYVRYLQHKTKRSERQY